MGLQTILYAMHQQLGAKIVDFAGWDMPLHYGSQIKEHLAVRQDAGVFDVSHMAVLDLQGPDVTDYLRYLLANDVARLKQTGKVLYTCMLNDAGGILDDLLVYFLKPEHYIVIVNAGTRHKDIAWMREKSLKFRLTITEVKAIALLAIQGPNARSKAAQALSPLHAQAMQSLAPFTSVRLDNWLIARTGYTGEEGIEVVLPADQAAAFWTRLLEVGVMPCGLGARDTLRLEAGMNLYGMDMDEETTPLESNLAWTIAWEPEERKFIGREALIRLKSQGLNTHLVGLILQDKGILRHGQQVSVADNQSGVITSGSYSPSLELSIALARIPLRERKTCQVDIRGKWLTAQVVKPPFVRHGKPAYTFFEERIDV